MVTAGRNTRKKNTAAKNVAKTTRGKKKARVDPPMPDDKAEEYAREVAERIVAARKLVGLTQVELAELVGVSPRSMQGYENAEVVPYRKMKDLAKVLNRPVEWLLHGDEAIAPADIRLGEIEKKLEQILRKLK